MKIFIFGGTGLLGSVGAKELIARGHEVSAIALPPLPNGLVLPKEMKIEYGNFDDMSDDKVKEYLRGMDGVAFCAGVDERISGKPPIYDMFYKHNIAPLDRFLRLAKESGVRHAVVLGSYFSYFDKIWPDMNLASIHPYIRSRRDQEKLALSYADETFDVAVLELPYIFGVQPGRKPVWVFMVEIIKRMPLATYFCKGGTTMVTTTQVGQAIAGVMEQNKGGNTYPIGYYNMQWKELYKTFHKYMGMPKRAFITIPKCFFTMFSKGQAKGIKKAGNETGLNYSYLGDLMTKEMFIDKEQVERLGVTGDDIDKAIGESVTLCMEVLDKKIELVDMKA